MVSAYIERISLFVAQVRFHNSFLGSWKYNVNYLSFNRRCPLTSAVFYAWDKHLELIGFEGFITC